MAQALYTKYRPQIFEDVVGQELIERTLKNAIDQDMVSHAYLFCGPRGTGKTTTARLLAKALLCQKGPTSEPDGTCEDCKLIADGMHPDVYELDAASRTGVENVREEIIGRVHFAATRGAFKIYIIDEVHMLSTAAFNALLKTLEEPPDHVVFILCTTDQQKVPETIHSRCQRFDFRRISPEAIVSRLGAICMAEGVEFEGEALDLIALRAEGGMRNALTSLEQIIVFDGGKVTKVGAERLLGSIDSDDLAEIMAAIGKRDIAAAFRFTADYVETGADLAQFTRDMAEHVRNLYVLCLAGDDAELEVDETARSQLILELQWFTEDRLARMMGVLGDLTVELKTSSNPRLSFEIALTRMVRPDSDLTLESLAERIASLEAALAKMPLQAMPRDSRAEPAASTSDAPASVQACSGGRKKGAAPEPEALDEGLSESCPDLPFDPAGVRSFDARFDTAEDAHIPAPAESDRASAASVAEMASSVSADAPAASHADAHSGARSTSDGHGKRGAAALKNPAQLQRVWQAALTTMKKKKEAYGVLFLGTRASFDADSSSLLIEFPEANAFAFKAVQKRDVEEALSAALNAVTGYEVPFRYGRFDPASGARTSSSAPAQAASAKVSRSKAASHTAGSRSGNDSTRTTDAAPVVASAQPQPQPQPSAVQDDYPPYDDYDLPPYDEPPYDDPPYEPDYTQQDAEPLPFDEPTDPSSSVHLADEPATQPITSDDAAPAVPAGQDSDPGSDSSNGEGDAEADDDIASILMKGFGSGVIVREVD